MLAVTQHTTANMIHTSSKTVYTPTQINTDQVDIESGYAGWDNNFLESCCLSGFSNMAKKGQHRVVVIAGGELRDKPDANIFGLNW